MEEDQEFELENSRRVVKEQAHFMKKSIESANLRDSLRFATGMLSELKTSSLSPKFYNILFMQVFDEMQVLKAYFKEEYKRGRKLAIMYESVQYATSLLPRLYLLVTVGSVYIESQELPASKLLADLLDMIKAVQHPMRGLFMRYYFLKMCKNYLPDNGNEYEGAGGDVLDSMNFILNNLKDMNKLWIRMAGKDKGRKEKERIALNQTIGENLHRLSQLEGVTLPIYQNEIANCGDKISQQYLIDCLIQAFPDEYHLNTLQLLLTTVTTKLEAGVDVKTIFIRLMERLASYANYSEQPDFSINIFELFKKSINTFLEEDRGDIDLKKFLDLEVAFLNFTLNCYSDKVEYVSEIITSCVKLCSKQPPNNFTPECQECIVKFLTLPLKTMSLAILRMEDYPKLMKYLPYVQRKRVANKIGDALVGSYKFLNDLGIPIEVTMSFIEPILKPEKTNEEVTDYEFKLENEMIARLVQMIHFKDIQDGKKILDHFKNIFVGCEPARIKIVMPSIISAYFTLVKEAAKSAPESVELYLKETEELIKLLAENSIFDQALKLYLALSLCINSFDSECKFDDFTENILTESFMIFQEEIADLDDKINCLTLIIGTLVNISCLSNDNYETMITNATQYCAKILKKNNQCQLILQCTHLFYNDFYQNSQRLFECFKKCLKLADNCCKTSPTFVTLYISIVSKFLYFFGKGVDTFKKEDIEQCLKLINDFISKLNGKEEGYDHIITYHKSTMEYIKVLKETDGAIGTHFADIEIPVE